MTCQPIGMKSEEAPHLRRGDTAYPPRKRLKMLNTTTSKAVRRLLPRRGRLIRPPRPEIRLL